MHQNGRRTRTASKDLGAGMTYGRAKGDGAPFCGTVFRLYANRTQAAQMEAMFALVDEAYDELLAYCVRRRRGGYKHPAEKYMEKAIERGDLLGAAKYDGLPSDVRDYALHAVLQALDARPLDEPPVPRTERSDRYRGSYTGKPSGSAFVADPRHVVLPYVDGLVKARVSREVGYVYSVTVRREPDGKYYASALSRRPVQRQAPSSRFHPSPCCAVLRSKTERSSTPRKSRRP